MRIIEVSALGWRGPLDFYDAVLRALEAPDWHGKSINALIDSIIVGSINGIEPPYRIEVSGLEGAAPNAREELSLAFEALGEEGATVNLAMENASLEML